MEQLVRSLLAVLRDGSATLDDAMVEAQRLLDSPSSDIAALNKALTSLNEAVVLPDRLRGGFAAIVCGALIERGGDPSLVAASFD